MENVAFSNVIFLHRVIKMKAAAQNKITHERERERKQAKMLNFRDKFRKHIEILLFFIHLVSDVERKKPFWKRGINIATDAKSKQQFNNKIRINIVFFLHLLFVEATTTEAHSCLTECISRYYRMPTATIHEKEKNSKQTSITWTCMRIFQVDAFFFDRGSWCLLQIIPNRSLKCPRKNFNWKEASGMRKIFNLINFDGSRSNFRWNFIQKD